MSFLIAVALNSFMREHPHRKEILNSVSLPDFVQQDIDTRLKAYLSAISLNGFSKQKIRKMIVLGNRGKIKFHISFSSIPRNKAYEN